MVEQQDRGPDRISGALGRANVAHDLGIGRGRDVDLGDAGPQFDSTGKVSEDGCRAFEWVAAVTVSATRIRLDRVLIGRWDRLFMLVAFPE